MDNPLKYIDPDGMWTETADGWSSDNAEEAQAFFKQLQSSNPGGDDKDKGKKKKPDPKPKAKEKDDPISHKISRGTNYFAAVTIVVGLGPEDPVADVAATGEEIIGQGAAGLAWLIEAGIDLYTFTATFTRSHGNSDENSDPQIVYEILSMDANGGIRTEKYGISGREDNQDGNNGRPAYQVNKLNKNDPTRAYSWVKLAQTDSRASAKTIETFLVSQYVAKFHRMPPLQILPLPK